MAKLQIGVYREQLGSKINGFFLARRIDPIENKPRFGSVVDDREELGRRIPLGPPAAGVADIVASRRRWDPLAGVLSPSRKRRWTRKGLVPFTCSLSNEDGPRRLSAYRRARNARTKIESVASVLGLLLTG